MGHELTHAFDDQGESPRADPHLLPAQPPALGAGRGCRGGPALPSIASCVLVPARPPPLLSSCLPRWHPPIPPPGFSVQLSLHPLGEDTVSAAPAPSSSSSPRGAGRVPLASALLCAFTAAPELRWGSMGEFGVTNLAWDSGDAPGDGWGPKCRAKPQPEPAQSRAGGHHLPRAGTQGAVSPPHPILLQEPPQRGLHRGLTSPGPTTARSCRAGVRQGGQPAAMVAELLPRGLQEPDSVHDGAVRPLHRPP